MEEGKNEIDKAEENNISNQLENLKLTAEEKGKVMKMEDEELQKKVQDLENVVVCKIATEKHINP